jgi:2-oxo-4-hydroxy-4-carboxy-5-ureidoimidazoline decarboxylase
MTPEEARHELSRCCGCARWIDLMIEHRPFEHRADLFNAAEIFWFELDKEDWLEAFTHHPKIGDIRDLAAKFPETSDLSADEQKKISKGNSEQLAELKKLNDDYEQKFGFIFILCAQKKSITEVLQQINLRIKNSYEQELEHATAEQNKITRLRLEAAF